MAEVPVYGPACNAGFVRRWISTDPLFGKFLLRAIDHRPFVDDWDASAAPEMGYILVIGLGLIRQPGIPVSSDKIFATLMGEFLAPFVAPRDIMTMDEARRIVVMIVNTLKIHAKLPSITAWTRDLHVPGGEDDQIPEGVVAVYGQFTNNDLDGTDFPAAMRILYRMCNMLKPLIRIRTVSTSFVRKVTEGIQADTGYDISIREDALVTFYTQYGGVITERNVENFFER